MGGVVRPVQNWPPLGLARERALEKKLELLLNVVPQGHEGRERSVWWCSCSLLISMQWLKLQRVLSFN